MSFNIFLKSHNFLLLFRFFFSNLVLFFTILLLQQLFFTYLVKKYTKKVKKNYYVLQFSLSRIIFFLLSIFYCFTIFLMLYYFFYSFSKDPQNQNITFRLYLAKKAGKFSLFGSLVPMFGLVGLGDSPQQNQGMATTGQPLSSNFSDRFFLMSQTSKTVEWLARKMVNEGHSVAVLSGDLEFQQRLAVLDGFRAGREQILLCTDVLSRGLVTNQVVLVINFDLPVYQKERIGFDTYFYRVTRSGESKAFEVFFILILFKKKIYSQFFRKWTYCQHGR